MLTSTLFDVAAITRLRPTGEIYNPSTESKENKFDFSINRASYSNFIVDHFEIEISEVSDQEHIAFLTFWLSYFVLCTSSLQVVKKLKGMVIQLHEGRNFCLSKLLL